MKNYQKSKKFPETTLWRNVNLSNIDVEKYIHHKCTTKAI